MKPALDTPWVALPSGLATFALLPMVQPAPIVPVDTALLDGFAHPLLHVGHVLTVLVLGVMAVQLGGKARWTLLVLLAALMAFGAVLGAVGAEAPMLDTIILTTTLCFGLLILAKVRVGFAVIASVAGAFALFHGLSDGSVIADLSKSPTFALGFAIGNLIAYLAGVALGEWIHRRTSVAAQHLRESISRWGGRFLGV